MRLHLLLVWTVFPPLLLSESQNLHIRYTGAPSDGGQNCSSCHSGVGAANSDTRGSVAISAIEYNPGLTQIIQVTVAHPTASSWGFQMTARMVSDETQEAGTFLAGPQTQIRCDDGTALGSASPCVGTREFAEHSPAARGVSGSFTYAVQWTPPTNEVGDIRLYVAAVAGDGDGTAQGDRVYTTMVTISPVGACTLSTKPTLVTAKNGASFLPAFSSNAMLSVFGSDFQVAGRSRLAGSGDILNGKFPTQLACVQVLMNGLAVPIAYVNYDQINIQAPPLSGSGPVTMTVVVNPGKPNELRSDLATLTSVQAFAPAFFLLSGSSTIAAQFANTAIPVTDTSPAKAGDVITLYATGLGATTPAVASGTVATSAAQTTNPVTVTVNGTQLAAPDVLYAGLSPGSISGLYQINIRIPANAPSGNLPVVATVGGFQTQVPATIVVRNPL